MSMNTDIELEEKADNPPCEPEHEKPPEEPTPHMPDYNATLYVFTRHQSRPIHQNDGHSHVALVLDVDVKKFPGLLQKFETEYDEITPQRLRDRLVNTGRVKILVSGYPAQVKEEVKEEDNCCTRTIEAFRRRYQGTPLWLQPSTTEQRHGFLEEYRGYRHEAEPHTHSDSNPNQEQRNLGRFYRTYVYDGKEEKCRIEKNPDGTVRVMRRKTPPTSQRGSSFIGPSLKTSFLGNEAKYEDREEDREFDRKKDLKYKRQVLHLSINMDRALSYLAKLIDAQALTAEHLKYDVGYGDYLVINQKTNKKFSLCSSVGYLLCCQRENSANCTTLVADLLDLRSTVSSRDKFCLPFKAGVNALSLTLPALVQFLSNIDLLGDFQEDIPETIASWFLIITTLGTLIVSTLQCACDKAQCSGSYASCFILSMQIACLGTLIGSYIHSESGDRIRMNASVGRVTSLAGAAALISTAIACLNMGVQRHNGWVLRPTDLYAYALKKYGKSDDPATTRALDTTPDSSRLTYFPYSGPPYSYSSVPANPQHDDEVELEDPTFEQEHKGSDDEETGMMLPRRFS